MTRYQNGANREYNIIHYLEAKGFKCIRSAGSHTAVDIVCIGNGRIFLIQSKKDKLSDKALFKELQALQEVCPERYIYVTPKVLSGAWVDIKEELDTW